MYVGKPNEESISAYLNGYEAGTENQCEFTHSLSSSIEVEYKIKSSNTWWIGQIEELARQQGVEWLTAFKRQSLKVLATAFDDATIKTEFTDFLKKRVASKMARIDYHFGKGWIVDWFGICDLSASWFKAIWTQRELELMARIEKALKTYDWMSELSEKIQPSELLKAACKELTHEIGISPC